MTVTAKNMSVGNVSGNRIINSFTSHVFYKRQTGNRTMKNTGRMKTLYPVNKNQKHFHLNS